MAVTVHGAALYGVDALPIEVEVDLLRRLPRVTVVGLAASAVKESSERIRSAIASAGLDFPRKRVVVNLAPADLPKRGTAFDLPIALGILAADEQVPELGETLFVGELSLGGELRPVRGALSVALLAREQGRSLIVPRGCGVQAAMVPGLEVFGAETLAEVVAHLRGQQLLSAIAPPALFSGPVSAPDLRDVRGQGVARRALEIAAAGAHHLLMSGPPGCGKTMLAQRLPGLLPPMTFDEALDTSRVHSAAGLLGTSPLVTTRPFRAPHHTITPAGLVGDRLLRPGEVSLAHNGVLFLDEAPEFPRSVLEVLRQPLEDGRVCLSRAAGTVEYPAAVTLVMAANPCPCGRYGAGECTCTGAAIQRYQRRLSGPVLDRVDLHVQLEAVSADDLIRGDVGESTQTVRARVMAARQRQHARQQARPNGQLDAAGIEAFVQATPQANHFLAGFVGPRGLSARGASRVLKVARTVADLDASAAVQIPHVAEAMAFRAMEAPC